MADSYGEIRQRLSDYVLNEAGVQDLREMAATMAVRRLDKMFKTAEAQESLKVREDGCVAVVAQMGGIVYLNNQGCEPAFCKVGDVVKAGVTVALIEAMKLYNEVMAPCDGVVVEIVCKNDTSVELDDPLMWIRPSEEQPVAPE